MKPSILPPRPLHGLLLAALLLALLGGSSLLRAEPTFTLGRADYEDRVKAIWLGQIIAVSITLPFEHEVAAVVPVRDFPKPYTTAWVDDDWYYEMCAVRAFEKHGTTLTVDQLGEQWLENNCGSYGSSATALRNLKAGIKGSESGHPRHNSSWFTIGPVFSSELYGVLNPGLPNSAGALTRRLAHINGYAEAVDGAVIWAGAISLGFTQSDVRSILRQAVALVDASSPYRQSVESVIRMADEGRGFDEIVQAIEDRWRTEYPTSNNAVANGGIAAASLWFCEGEFWKAIDLASRAADFTDTDNSAASAVAVLCAIHGMKILPPELVARMGSRIVGTKMGDIEFTPPVDESIDELARRTAVIGEKFILESGARALDTGWEIPKQTPRAQPPERFSIGELTRYWNPDWTLERAGNGITCLTPDGTLVTYPRDARRGLVLHRKVKLGDAPRLTFEARTAPDRVFTLAVYADNKKLLERRVAGAPGEEFETFDLDLRPWAGRECVIRLYQKVRQPKDDRLPGAAYWRNVVIR